MEAQLPMAINLSRCNEKGKYLVKFCVLQVIVNILGGSSHE